MEHKCNKQLWLESILKQLYKKVDALEAIKGKPRNYQKKKLNVPSLKISDMRKEEIKEDDDEEDEDIDSETTGDKSEEDEEKEDMDPETIGDRRKEDEKEEKKDMDPETVNSSEKQETLIEDDHAKFWNFVDEFIQSNVQAKPFQARTKSGFFNSVKVPSTINCTHWKSEALGSTIAFPPRIIYDSFTFLEDPREGLLKTEIGEEGTLEEKIVTKIQKIRMKKSADVIFKEVIEDLKKAKQF